MDPRRRAGFGGFLQQVSCTLERGGPREAGFTEQRLRPAPCSGRITCPLLFRMLISMCVALDKKTSQTIYHDLNNVC
uniref:Uncharacterized protein n=1 Tax=Picea glauca TaxID=3330 RepID=A0A101LTP2_PICGL|nr:hypothetical protein ABT39_MTgene3609 [Picea glauca]